MQTDSSRIMAQTQLEFIIKKRMETSSKEMGKQTEMKEKVILEEEASWAKLCSKLVSKYIYSKDTF